MIGIILYVSVVKRTILKTIGAYRKDIRRIFICEGFAIGTLGQHNRCHRIMETL